MLTCALPGPPALPAAAGLVQQVQRARVYDVRAPAQPTAALLELSLADWGNCQYSRNFMRRGYMAECQSHPRAHPARRDFWTGVKPDDLIVVVENVTRGAARLVERLGEAERESVSDVPARDAG